MGKVLSDVEHLAVLLTKLNSKSVLLFTFNKTQKQCNAVTLIITLLCGFFDFQINQLILPLCH